MPTLPNVAVEILRLTRDPNSNLTQFVDIIQSDIALTGKVLRAANSAYYGVPRKVDNIRLATVILGMTEIANLVTGISVVKSFGGGDRSSSFNREEFWKHSGHVAGLTQYLHKASGLPKIGGAFIGGLLHDVGKLILDQFFSDLFEKVRALQIEQSISAHQAEMQVLGIDHGHIGGWLLSRWNLPEEVIQGVATHHIRPEDTSPESLGVVIQWADFLAHTLASSGSEKGCLEKLSVNAQWNAWAGSRHLKVELFVKELYGNPKATFELPKL